MYVPADVQAIDDRLTRALEQLPAAEGDLADDDLADDDRRARRLARFALAFCAGAITIATLLGLAGCAEPPAAPPCVRVDTVKSADCVLSFIVTAPCDKPITIDGTRKDCPPREVTP